MSHPLPPWFDSFCAGQEKLDREAAEYEARVAEEAQREIENRSYNMSKHESPEQRLNRANMAMDLKLNVKEEPLTESDLGGLSWKQFLALPPERRLAIAHGATEARKSRC